MNLRRVLLLVVAAAIVLIAWTNLRLATKISPAPTTADASLANSRYYYLTHNTTTAAAAAAATTAAAAAKKTTKILGFADAAYVDYAIRWYHRLEQLGYQEHVIVAVDQATVDYFRKNYDDPLKKKKKNLRWEELPYKPCVKVERDSRRYRRQLFGRRWKYVYDQLQAGHSILLTDVDNVFSRYLSMQEMEDSEFDIFHAYSTSYPTYVFEDMGLTVCGGMSWLRADPKVIRFVGTLVNQCKCLKHENAEQLCKDCMCDDQVVLNELLWKGKHKVTWDRDIAKPKPISLKDWQWDSMTGISAKTRHRIHIWDRNIAYRAPMPDTCPPNNWVSMPLYVNRSHVVQVWDDLCSVAPTNGTDIQS